MGKMIRELNYNVAGDLMTDYEITLAQYTDRIQKHMTRNSKISFQSSHIVVARHEFGTDVYRLI